MIVVYSDHALSCTTIFELVRRFKDRQLNIEDNSRSYQPITATDNQTVKDIERLIIELKFNK